MVWFWVDDKFHSHNKIRKVLADDPAALALWVVAGSWSADNLTDGLIKDHQLPWLIPAGADELARKLVTAQLWRRVRGGYQFHDWDHWNKTREQVLTTRQARADAGRKGGLSKGKKSSKSQANTSASASQFARQNRTPTPPHPPPPKGGGGKSAQPHTAQSAAHAFPENPGAAPSLVPGFVELKAAAIQNITETISASRRKFRSATKEPP